MKNLLIANYSIFNLICDENDWWDIIFVSIAKFVFSEGTYLSEI